MKRVFSLIVLIGVCFAVNVFAAEWGLKVKETYNNFEGLSGDWTLNSTDGVNLSAKIKDAEVMHLFTSIEGNVSGKYGSIFLGIGTGSSEFKIKELSNLEGTGAVEEFEKTSFTMDVDSNIFLQVGVETDFEFNKNWSIVPRLVVTYYKGSTDDASIVDLSATADNVIADGESEFLGATFGLMLKRQNINFWNLNSNLAFGPTLYCAEYENDSDYFVNAPGGEIGKTNAEFDGNGVGLAVASTFSPEKYEKLTIGIGGALGKDYQAGNVFVKYSW